MKAKVQNFLNRKVSMSRAITTFMEGFLVAVALVILWAIAMTGGWSNFVNTMKFSQVLSVIEHTYIGEADTTALSDAAFATMIKGLNDRWSYYMTAEEFEHYKQVQSNNYTGVGVTIRQTEDGWQVAGVVPESPAEKAGITAGLYLLSVNGTDVTSAQNGEIAELMRKTPEHIELVLKNTSGEQFSYTVAMEELYTNPVTYEMKDGNIGYIKIENFDETSGEQGIAAIEALMDQGATALVFDVRNNGGGYVTELCKLLDYLLPEGEIFVSVDDEGNEKVTKSDENFVDLPMAVLVNENSYSAAEFFPACLSEYGAATIVGAQTTGKNRSQINMVLFDGSAVHISSRQYLTPNRVDLTEQGGLTPDIVVELGKNDAQLEAALALFR